MITETGLLINKRRIVQCKALRVNTLHKRAQSLIKGSFNCRCWQQQVRFYLMFALQSPRASPSLQGEYSLVLFTQHDQRPSAAASGMISFGGSDDDMDDSLSQVASDTWEELSGSLTDPGILPPSSSCNARPRGDEELASWPAHSYQMEGEGESSVQAMQSHFCTRWTRILGSWTSGFGAALYGCGPGPSRPRCAPVRRPALMQLHSETWGAQ